MVMHRDAFRWSATVLHSVVCNNNNRLKTWYTADVNVRTIQKGSTVNSAMTFSTIYHGDRRSVMNRTNVVDAIAIDTRHGVISIKVSMSSQEWSVAVYATIVSTIRKAKIVKSVNRSSTKTHNAKSRIRTYACVSFVYVAYLTFVLKYANLMGYLLMNY
jgi:hypothetical protein